ENGGITFVCERVQRNRRFIAVSPFNRVQHLDECTKGNLNWPSGRLLVRYSHDRQCARGIISYHIFPVSRCPDEGVPYQYLIAVITIPQKSKTSPTISPETFHKRAAASVSSACGCHPENGLSGTAGSASWQSSRYKPPFPFSSRAVAAQTEVAAP